MPRGTESGPPLRALACRVALASVIFVAWLAGTSQAAAVPPAALGADAPLAPPAAGTRTLRVISPTVLEFSAIVAGSPQVPPDYMAPVPPPEFKPEEFKVTVAGAPRSVTSLGYRRRPVYAPLRPRDLRIGHFIYLQVAEPIAEAENVDVAYTGKVAGIAGGSVSAAADPLRLSPAIHVNQVGYAPEAAKLATVGYYLGTLGELPLGGGSADRATSAPSGEPPSEFTPTGATATSGSRAGRPGAHRFRVIASATGETVLEGELRHRAPIGMPGGWYQQVFEADFSALRQRGTYRLVVPGLGASYPFRVDEGVAATFARTYALGLYHQRCGAANELPFSPYHHGPCHTAAAEVPRKAATQLAGFPATPIDADLFPFVRKGKVDVSGGHHDAGDYSKYTINSTGFVHLLMFAVDSMAGVAGLDNLGLPESGDGRSDVLQIAKWEADFLVKMQDEDGGFYFLVYPRDRRYEDNVLPDKGDPQIVWPKNTAATAAAVAALAQAASSPQMRQHYPQEAARYLAAARKGWTFIQAAEARHGRGRAYRKFTHYGDEFQDADEIVWAATELFLATQEKEFADIVHAQLKPRDPHTRRWGWRRLTDAYGHAIRSYAFAAKSGRVPATGLDRRLLLMCEDEIIACADDWVRAARENPYGSSYPEATRRKAGGGWYFSTDHAFDIAVAAQLDFPTKNDRRPEFRAAVWSNINYDAGANPLSLSFVTGLGARRPMEIVHQYAQNDRRLLPLPGIPIGSIQESFSYGGLYKGELIALAYPLDGGKPVAYPVLDRFGDSYNLQTEFVILNQARALAISSWLMADTPAAKQPWKSGTAEIVGLPGSVGVNRKYELSLKLPADLQVEGTLVTWEARGHAPVVAPTFSFKPKNTGTHWIEAEALLPDGRRVFASANVRATGAVVFWINGSLPQGAEPILTGGDTWDWTRPTAKPAELQAWDLGDVPQHESRGTTPLHEHGFDNAEATLAVDAGDVLFAYAFLDPKDPPREIMLCWNDGSWEHRAFWGEDRISYGEHGSAGRRNMGKLPKTGEWVRLEVPASAVALEGRTVKGMCFSVLGGKAAGTPPANSREA